MSPELARELARHEELVAATWAELTPDEKLRARHLTEVQRVRDRVDELTERLELHRSGHTVHRSGCGFPDCVCDCRESELDYLEHALDGALLELERIVMPTGIPA